MLVGRVAFLVVGPITVGGAGRLLITAGILMGFVASS